VPFADSSIISNCLNFASLLAYKFGTDLPVQKVETHCATIYFKKTMIQLENVTKYYSAGAMKTFILRNISLTIKQGEFVSIMGPSGSGKSTLLHILGMLDEQSEGEYTFLDKPVHKLTEKQRSVEQPPKKLDKKKVFWVNTF
jgi:ABC-type glutathione transport system ATPase component